MRRKEKDEMVGFLGWVISVVGATEERSNIQEKTYQYLFRDTSLYVVRGVVCTGQSETEDAKTNIQNPQFTISISELGKYTRNKRKY